MKTFLSTISLYKSNSYLFKKRAVFWNYSGRWNVFSPYRIDYRIVGDKAEIAEIIIVGKREDNEVYQEAYKRLQELKRDY